MTHARRLAAILAIAFFAVLNAGTSQQPVSTPAPAPGVTPAPVPGPATQWTRSCQRPDGRCSEHRFTPLPGMTPEQAEMGERLGCEQNGRGTWGPTPCPTVSLLGRCTLPSGAVFFYYAPGWTAADAQSTCQLVGSATWAPN